MSRDEEIRAYFDNTINLDLFRSICGTELGGGMSRVVYACNIRPDLVLKFENGTGCFQNIMEWQVWQELQNDKRASRWLAPCEFISPCGTVLGMRRTEPLSTRQLPRQVPAFLTDFSRRNFGMLGGRVVCHDYGLNRLLSLGAQTRLRNASWWSTSQGGHG